MKINKKYIVPAMLISFSLTACSNNANKDANKVEEPKTTVTTTEEDKNKDTTKKDDKNKETTDDKSKDDSSKMDMEHNESGEVPEGIKEAKDPKFPVGTHIISKADHMEGMDGAKGTVVGAYNDYVYAVTYTSTVDGKEVKNHKWVVQQEIDGSSDEPYKVGDEVTLNADHMEGMKGAKATIDEVKETNVYMLDLDLTNGKVMKNHKWVTEDELELDE